MSTERKFTDDELLEYLDELLPIELMTQIEQALRDSEALRHRLAGLIHGNSHKVHSVGAIWRRHQLSCPSRTDLGNFLLGILPPEAEQYIDFHIRTIGCRYCSANLKDLEDESAESSETETRRRRFFQSSAGLLRRDTDLET